MRVNTYIEDDDFDWEAAVSEIDRVCSKAEASGGAVLGFQSSQTQSTQKLKQKTLDSFIRDGKGRQLNEGEQQQNTSGISSRWSWNQGHQFNITKQHEKSSAYFLRENGNEVPRFADGKQQQRRTEHSFKEKGNQGHQFRKGKQHQSNSEVPFRDNGNQGRVETSWDRAQQEHASRSLQANFHCEIPFDPVTARTWIYPANVPCRTYQFNITKVALFTNTLVSLPTGLGKTLIAAAVMYNYFRWFPTGKIIFAAPSRPLVVQQIEACHRIVGIPQDMTIDMTGDMSPLVRAEYWQTRRVFFVTPQCLEKDIESGTCLLRQIVCLVLDEAHRATGNYSYCVIVRKLLAAKIDYRLLALTATPGSKQTTIQDVVDNLQISCLEYRNEDDPDVSQYTHSRKIELIEVPMNAESNQAKDLLVEVLQPIVYRLCGFKVFYNREIARLTPFEFIQAREKFRQAPPPAIPQNEYSQVEMYFGLAITLTHIFKLLFTHGMRPAYEMLQQKLQQGVLKRLQANEKMRHLQSVMKQSVGHGAPSPKLEKVVEIISTHFSTHDPTKTRVIIFTNFRESVKDIMEILAARCTDVKAMEFIGQSSGKASKGQSQKTQQAVLQKFRAGGFNTIVATSIAEEGLDIMEVDLVICFDANISPLRMIQRMGRTGRKRDGRVVVLACEGAEKEGYLAKQNKNKALKKHMVNGGVFSFNFHPSSHMIPHSYRPAVQMVELAIEDFVPRTKKLKARQNEAIIGGLRSLSEEELQLLDKYKIASEEEIWKPSLIAFPQYQVIPTPVYKVKHSHRTSVLIDALRSLQETPALTAGTIQNPEQEKVNVNAPAEGIFCSPQDHETEILSCTPETNDTGNGVLKSAPQQKTLATTKENLEPVNMLGGHRELSVEEKDLRQDVFVVDLDKSPLAEIHRLVEDVRDTTDATIGGNLTVADNQNIRETTKNSAKWRSICNTAATQETGNSAFDEHLQNNSLTDIRSFGPHRCKYSSGVVYTTESGLVVVASPPSLPSVKSDRKWFTTSNFHVSDNSINPLSHNSTCSSGFKLAVLTPKSMPTVKLYPLEDPEKCKGVVTSESPHVELRQNADMKFVPPKYKPPQVIEAHSVGGAKSGSGAETVSSRLADIATQGVVPSSPVAEPLFDDGYISRQVLVKAPSGCEAGHDDVQRRDNTTLESAARHESTPTTPLSTASGTVLAKRNSHSEIKILSTGSMSKKTPVSSFLCRINGMSPPKGKLLRFSEDCSIAGRNDGNISYRNDPLIICEGSDTLGGHVLPNSGGCREDITTPQGRSQKSPSEEWQNNESKGSVSVERPRKLKRLCKAGEKRIRPTPKLKRLKKVGAEGYRLGSKSSRSELKEGKNRRKLLVRKFLDEEAEVSGDDESSDRFDSEEDDEAEVDGFIDSAGTQHLNGSVDMMAVYRRSLLTQSPADIQAKYAHLLQTSPATCSQGSPASSEDICVSPAGALPGPFSGGGDSSPARIDSDGRKPFLNQFSRFIQTSVTSADGGNMCTTSTSKLIYEEQRKLELRKRKLSFQPNTVNPDVSAPSSHRPQKEHELCDKGDSYLLARETQGTRSSDLVKQRDQVVEFEDDLFDGVDLDALEAEAAQTCRTRSQKAMDSHQEVHQKQDFDLAAANLKAQHCGNIDPQQRLMSRLPKDDNFGGCPSFDLGLDD